MVKFQLLQRSEREMKDNKNRVLNESFAPFFFFSLHKHLSSTRCPRRNPAAHYDKRLSAEWPPSRIYYTADVAQVGQSRTDLQDRPSKCVWCGLVCLVSRCWHFSHIFTFLSSKIGRSTGSITGCELLLQFLNSQDQITRFKDELYIILLTFRS